MPATSTTTRTQKPRQPFTRRVKNPTGRVDWLVMSLLDRGLKLHGGELLTRMYEEFRPDLEREVVRVIGPRTKRGRTIKRLVRGMMAPPPPQMKTQIPVMVEVPR